MKTSWPALTQCRASAPPIRPVPMMPIFSGSCASTDGAPTSPAAPRTRPAATNNARRVNPKLRDRVRMAFPNKLDERR